MLYAQINPETKQMINTQIELPERWITPDGVTITRFNKLPIDVLKSLGWLPVIYDEIVSEAYFYQEPPKYDEKNNQFIYEAIPYDIELLRNDALQRIDQTASNTCAKYISQGVGQDARYLMKHIQAVDYLVDVPNNIEKYPMIKKEAELSGMSYVDMANLIINTANEWINIAAEIESIRCSTKMKIKKAKDNAEIVRLRDNAITGLETL